LLSARGKTEELRENESNVLEGSQFCSIALKILKHIKFKDHPGCCDV